ncbi:MAG: hypothetical protein KBS54_05020 [Synergistaceae bacterium]|nr:hypothetical protein [Candidatus Equadaptatus faecalis]
MQYGFWSIVPPILTIVLALVTKNVFVSLFIGIFLGSFIIADWNFIAALNAALNNCVKTMASSGNTIVIASMLFIGALIYLIERSGGVDGFVDVMVKKNGIIKSKRGANIFTWLLGVLIFTSGSLSCMVTGSVARPVNDALKVPHEKAAFIIHATSTPVCVLIPLSGWLAAMIGYLTSGGVAEADAIPTLIKSICLNFYCIFAVLGVLVLAVLQKDFGPMKAAEERAAETGMLDDPAHAKEGGEISRVKISDAKPRVMNLVLPILTLLFTVIIALFVTGNGNLMKGSGMNSLLWGCFVSLVVMGALCVFQKIFTLNEVIDEMFKGMGSMLPIAFVLLLGFTMGSTVKALDTGNYLSSIFLQALNPAFLPALVFIIACLISFATGTSMGTMAIMFVIALPMAINLGVNIPLVAGAAFGGSIFGDHTSPISDTTIMSCSTSGCDIIDHVKTQTPYCAFFAGASLVLYVILGFVM